MTRSQGTLEFIPHSNNVAQFEHKLQIIQKLYEVVCLSDDISKKCNLSIDVGILKMSSNKELLSRAMILLSSVAKRRGPV